MIIEFQIQRVTGYKFFKFFSSFFLPISCRPIKSSQLPLKAKINKMKKQQQWITYGNYIFSIIAVGIVVVVVIVIIIIFTLPLIYYYYYRNIVLYIYI